MVLLTKLKNFQGRLENNFEDGQIKKFVSAEDFQTATLRVYLHTANSRR